MAQNSAGQESIIHGAFLQSGHAKKSIYVPDCGSPRETMQSFIQLSQAIKQMFEQGVYGDVNWEQEQKLMALYSKLAHLMDAESLPKSDRYAHINVISSQIVEIMDRIAPLDLEKIPTADQIGESTEYWRLPQTEIILSQITEGHRKGDWVFSGHTMHRADDLYHQIQHLPYHPDAIVGDINHHGGLLHHYTAYTGPLIPVSFTDRIPGFLHKTFLDNPIWKYIATFLLLLLLGGIFLGVRVLTRYRKDKYDDPNHIAMQLRRMVLPLTMVLLLPLTINLITIDIRLRLLPLAITDNVLWLVFYVSVFWLFVSLANVVSAMVIASPRISPFGLDASLIRMVCRLVAYLVGLWILVEGLQHLGLSLVPLIAGIGVGGLAFALAARPTLGNVLGGLMIYLDRPFKVGERVVINNHDGVVEEIGLRSTRIRTLNGHLLSVPNEEVSNNYVENIGQRPHIKRTLNVTLTYDTPPEKIKEAMAIIKKLLSMEEDGGRTAEELGRPANSCINSEKFPPRVYFNDLNADSLNILVLYWFIPADYFEYLAYTTWFNIELVARFNAAGIDFAFPTQTIELKKEA